MTRWIAARWIAARRIAASWIAVRRLALIVAPLAAVLALSACGEAPKASDRRITVSGVGAVAAAPDQARLQVGVASSADTAVAAVALNAERMASVYAALEDLGIAEADVRTDRLQLTTETQRRGDAEEEGAAPETQYVARNVITALLRDVDSVGPAFDALVAAGANRGFGLSFEVSDEEAKRAEAEVKAVAAARRKAERLAERLDADLGRVIEIVQGGAGGGPTYEMARAAATPVAPGERSIRATVRVTFELD